MATLQAVLAAPKKAKAPTDPHQKVLKKLARQGWNENGRGTKTVMVRQHDDYVFLTNTYVMRRFPIDGPIGEAIRSVIPETEDTDSVMTEGFQLSLTAGAGGEWINDRTCAEMLGVWPTDSDQESVLSDWSLCEDDSAHVVCDVPIACKLNAKYLKAVTDGIEDASIHAVHTIDDAFVRKPVRVRDRDGLLHAILMPVRF